MLIGLEQQAAMRDFFHKFEQLSDKHDYNCGLYRVSVHHRITEQSVKM